jgi:hypothetical protein
MLMAMGSNFRSEKKNQFHFHRNEEKYVNKIGFQVFDCYFVFVLYLVFMREEMKYPLQKEKSFEG